MNIEWLVVGLAAGLTGIMGFAWRWQAYRRANSERITQLAEQDRELQWRSVQAEIRAQGAAIQSLAVSLDRLQQQLLLDARHVATPARGGRAAYELAIRLAQSGASVDEICASCGMSRSEADLVHRLHRDGNSPATSRRLALAG
jgi:Protein of unknown function (DUF2802)